MKCSQVPFLPLGIGAVFVCAITFSLYGQVHQGDQNHRERFRLRGATTDEGSAGSFERSRRKVPPGIEITEAPIGFDNLTNGFDQQGPPFEQINEDTVKPLRSFHDNRFISEEVETNADGLGPTYNAQSCRECHQNVVTGGASQVAEHRTGHLEGDQFFESLGGSLIQSRATHPDIVERVAFEDDIPTFRISTNTLGNGFVECIADTTLLAIRDGQPAAIQGTALMVPVLEAESRPRVGRFGWKSQHASLQSFSADAYLNEMGITSPLFPEENTSSDVDVAPYDPVPDPEDDGGGRRGVGKLHAFHEGAGPSGNCQRRRGRRRAAFQRDRLRGVPCACNHDRETRARINGGVFTVLPALGNKIIHPYSDFLLHDIGTGDGIPVLPQFASTANQIRTAPLWALRTRNRLMHDGLSFTKQEAIQRHQGQAADVTTA
jgi:CxxC motif-containing protein (DUF1111 family)